MAKIAYKSDRYSSGKEELYGHGCYTREEMEQYCQMLGGGMEVVEDDFDFGTFVPEDQRPVKEPKLWIGRDGKPLPITPERRAAIEAVLKALSA